MNDRERIDELQEGLEAFGEASGNDADPLAKIEEKFTAVDADPFELYLLEDRHQKIEEESYDHWVRSFDQWRDFMESQGRHPACPNKFHVARFVDYLRNDRGNTEGVAKKKLFHVNAAFEWMQEEPQFATPSTFNPFKKWLKKGGLDASPSKRNYPRISLEELREQVSEIRNIRERAITVMQLKTGARSTEIANLDLRDININHPELKEQYSEIGTHQMNENHPNTVFIPAEKTGNKREVDTILPLDEETRQVVVDWLLIRPDNGKDALFFTDKGKRLSRNDIRYMWTQNWWPEYEFADDEDLDSITPHFARHHFTTWWRNEDIAEVKARYLRGDKTDEFNRARTAMDLYVHEHYEDIEDIYREKMFQLRLETV